MKVACIIPTYNFLEGVKRIAQWISKEYHLSVSDYRIIIVDDHSDSIYRSDFNRLSKLENFHILSSSGIRSLRLSILTGYDYIKEWNPDLIHIIETDAMPSTSTFQAMLRVYQEASGNVGSVSPIYTWAGENCYPTHKHWFSDIPTRENFSTGLVREPGKCGVPFLFSIWNPAVFKIMKNENLPHIMHLDSSFGASVHKAGYRHLRITNHSIDHWMKGRQSNALKISKK